MYVYIFYKYLYYYLNKTVRELALFTAEYWVISDTFCALNEGSWYLVLRGMTIKILGDN